MSTEVLLTVWTRLQDSPVQSGQCFTMQYFMFTEPGYDLNMVPLFSIFFFVYVQSSWKISEKMTNMHHTGIMKKAKIKKKKKCWVNVFINPRSICICEFVPLCIVWPPKCFHNTAIQQIGTGQMWHVRGNKHCSRRLWCNNAIMTKSHVMGWEWEPPWGLLSWVVVSHTVWQYYGRLVQDRTLLVVVGWFFFFSLSLWLLNRSGYIPLHVKYIIVQNIMHRSLRIDHMLYILFCLKITGIASHNRYNCWPFIETMPMQEKIL